MSILEKARALTSGALERATETATYVVGKATPLANNAVENLTTLVEQGKAKLGTLVDNDELARLRRIEAAALNAIQVNDEIVGKDVHTALARITGAVERLKEAAGE